ncbi:hypothetical protein MCAMS1_02269 [biofilm metagenome]
MHTVLIILDKYGWAYDTLARGLVDHAQNEKLSFDIVSAADDMAYIQENHHRYELVFVFGWTSVFSNKKNKNYAQLLPFLDNSKLITGIHSHRSWDNYLSQPDELPPPPLDLINKLGNIKKINVISRRLFRIFENAGLSNIVLTENGVDTELFNPSVPVNTDRSKPLKIGFSGSKDIAKHDFLKGFSEYILPLNTLHNVEVCVLGGRGANQVKREDMPALYNQIDLYICASTSEGFSQSVLEASACGRGIISTRVGGCEDLIVESHNGFFINRDINSIKQLVARLEADRDLVKQLGENNRKIVEETYSWDIRVKDWLDFIKGSLPGQTG